jgi:hypothetical protein
MSCCPHCGEALSDDWIKRQGASLMGKSGGKSKARATERMQAAALKRWENTPRLSLEEKRAATREYQRNYQRIYQKKLKEKKKFEKLCTELAAEAALLGVNQSS